MAFTAISDLWTPSIWIKHTAEAARRFPNLMSSGVVIQTPKMDEIASGGGLTANMPFFKDITDQDDEIQVENTGPNKLANTGGLMVAPILNRVTANEVGALAASVSGSDPVGFMTGVIGERRSNQRQKIVTALLRGAFNGTGAANAAAPLSAVRTDAFVEIVGNQTSAHLIDSTKVINTTALLGELQSALQGCVMFCHTQIRAALLAQDENSFERKSQGDLILEYYKGMRVVCSDRLVRAGTTSGFVYETYFLAPRTIGMGAKPQVGDKVDAASLQYKKDEHANNEVVYDRNRIVININGMKWVGTPAGQSATNAELAVATNWNLAYQTADRCGVALLRTNG